MESFEKVCTLSTITLITVKFDLAKPQSLVRNRRETLRKLQDFTFLIVYFHVNLTSIRPYERGYFKGLTSGEKFSFSFVHKPERVALIQIEVRCMPHNLGHRMTCQLSS